MHLPPATGGRERGKRGIREGWVCGGRSGAKLARIARRLGAGYKLYGWITGLRACGGWAAAWWPRVRAAVGREARERRRRKAAGVPSRAVGCQLLLPGDGWFSKSEPAAHLKSEQLKSEYLKSE